MRLRSLRRCAYDRTVDEPPHPGVEIWQRVVDGRLVAFQSEKKRNVGDITQRVGVADIFTPLHLLVERDQVLAQFSSRFFHFIIVRNIAAGALKPGVAVVDPNSNPCPLRRIYRHKGNVGIFLIQIFVDDRRLVDDGVAIHQDGNLSVRVKLEQLFGFIAEIAFDQLKREMFFRQDKPCPVGIRSGAVGK